MLGRSRGQSPCQDGGLFASGGPEHAYGTLFRRAVRVTCFPRRVRFSAGKERCAVAVPASWCGLFSTGRETAAEAGGATALSQLWGFFLYLSPTRPICQGPVRSMRGRKLTFWLDA